MAEGMPAVLAAVAAGVVCAVVLPRLIGVTGLLRAGLARAQPGFAR